MPQNESTSQLSTFKVYLLHTNIALSIIIIFLWSVIVVTKIKYLRNTHINLYIQSIVFAISLIFFVIGIVGTSIISISKGYDEGRSDFEAVRCLMGSGAHILRLLMLGICIERYISTTHITTYVNRNYWVFGGIRYLLMVNKSLRTAQSTLNVNYYAVRNLKILKVVEPQIMLHSAFGFLTVNASILTLVFKLDLMYQLYGFYTLYLVYYLLAAFVVFLQSYLSKRNNKIDDQQKYVVADSLGRPIPATVSSNIYFKELDAAWR
uniref:Serpentine receptor class gamma n=1 Tax=Panagrellus redivivus TaxID=6233 RepID=A0A7E4VCN8_PANRE